MSERGLGGENIKLSRERLREMRIGLRLTFIQKVSKSRQIEVSKGVEPSVEEGVKKNNVDRCSYQEGVEEQSKDTGKEAQSIHQLSRSYRGSRNFLDQSTQLSRKCRDCDKKQFKSSTDSQVSRRCQDCLKINFSRREKTQI